MSIKLFVLHNKSNVRKVFIVDQMRKTFEDLTFCRVYFSFKDRGRVSVNDTDVSEVTRPIGASYNIEMFATEIS